MAPHVTSPKALAHVVLRTSPDKLKEMREFYLKLLGAKVSYENEWACFMTYDFEHHRIAVIAMPGIETKKIASSPGLEVHRLNTLRIGSIDADLSYTAYCFHSLLPSRASHSLD